MLFRSHSFAFELSYETDVCVSLMADSCDKSISYPPVTSPGYLTPAVASSGSLYPAPSRSQPTRPIPRAKFTRQQRTRSVKVLRIASLNVGSMTSRGRELADVLKRRRIDIAAIQETRWPGAESKELGDGYKLIYYGVGS